MLSFVFILTFVSYAMSTTTMESLELKIVGGYDIDITEAPYQVVLKAILSCGGVIIAEDLVLTAAHCVQGARPEMFELRVGSSYHDRGGEIYPVGDFLMHPDFNVTASYDSDIAILWLSRPLTFSDSVAPIQMMSVNEEIPDGEMAVVTGWGNLNEGGHLSDVLQGLVFPIVNNEQCSAIHRHHHLYYITRNMLCAGFPEGGRDVCQGDSGGPVVYNNKLAGIVSFGYGCARRIPSVHAKISALRPWIDYSIAQLRLNQRTG